MCPLEDKRMDRDNILQELRRFKEINQGKYSIVSIGLFGSVARDKMNKRSDIDVVVELVKRDLFNIIHKVKISSVSKTFDMSD